MRHAVLALALLATGLPAGAQQLRFEMRLVVPAKTEGSIVAQDRDTAQPVLLSKDALLFYDRDIAAARVARDRSGSRVDISFTASVSELLYDFTAKQVGQRVGIVVGGELIFSARIAEPIRTALSLSGLTAERAESIVSLIAGRTASPKWPMKRTVFIGTEGDGAGREAKQFSYVVVPDNRIGQDSSEAAATIAKAMADGGYRILSVEEMKKADLARIAIIDAAVSDLHGERVNIEIKVGRFRGPIENHDVLLMWRGVFSMDTTFYTAFTQLALARAVGYYPLADIRKTEDW